MYLDDEEVLSRDGDRYRSRELDLVYRRGDDVRSRLSGLCERLRSAELCSRWGLGDVSLWRSRESSRARRRLSSVSERRCDRELERSECVEDVRFRLSSVRGGVREGVEPNHSIWLPGRAGLLVVEGDKEGMGVGRALNGVDGLADRDRVRSVAALRSAAKSIILLLAVRLSVRCLGFRTLPSLAILATKVVSSRNVAVTSESLEVCVTVGVTDVGGVAARCAKCDGRYSPVTGISCEGIC